MEKLSEIVRFDPAVSDVITISGYSIMSGSGTNMGFGVVVLKDWSERAEEALQPTAIVRRLNGQLWSIPEARAMVFNLPAIPGLGVVSGFDMRLLDTARVSPTVLAAAADAIVARANEHEALARVRHNFRANVPMYELEVDRDKTKLLGLNFGEVFQTLQAQLGGIYVNDFSQFGRTYRVMLESDERFRQRPEDLRNFQGRNAAGEMVPISNVAQLTPTEGPTRLEGFNLFRSVTINGEPAADVSSMEAVLAMEELLGEVYGEFDFAWAGQTLQEIEAGNVIVLLFSLAILAAYLFLVALYESWTLPIAVLLSVPLAFLGSFMALRLTGLPMDIYAQIGLVLLVAMATKTAILFVEFAMQLRKEGRSIVEAAREAAVLRFRAVIMTSLAFILGVVPLVTATGAGAASRVSLGVTVMSGMIAAMVLVTLMTPMLYVIVQDMRERFGNSQAASDQMEPNLQDQESVPS